MEGIELTAEQVTVIASWAEVGPGFVPLVVHVTPPSYARDWAADDVLVTQGDSYVHIGPSGVVKDVVPSCVMRLH